MKKTEFKKSFFELLDTEVDSLAYLERMEFVKKLLVEYQKENEKKRDTSNKRNKWTDEELKIILSDTPSRENCLKYAILFKRGYGSIEQIYRWSTTPDNKLSQRRQADSFVLQIKRIAKELG